MTPPERSLRDLKREQVLFRAKFRATGYLIEEEPELTDEDLKEIRAEMDFDRTKDGW